MATESRVAVVHGPAAAFANHVTIGPHTFSADEPESAGGIDLGPSPFEIVAAALGACTSMTISVYARSRKIPLEHVTVRVQHTRVTGQPGVRANRMERVIELRGELTEEQRAKLLEIAGKCPVHKALHEGVDVTTSLAP
jgi:putative redox protein